MAPQRDRILDLFNRPRTGSPAPPVQQSCSSGVATAASSAHTVPSSFSSGASVAWESVRTALVILKETCEWLPQFKAAAGGVVALIDAIELTSSNADDLELLRQKIDSLTSIIKENSRDRRFPWLLRCLSNFSENLNKIVANIDKKLDRGRIRRFVEGNKDRGDINAFVGAISDLVGNLQSELSLYTSRGINELLSNESLKKLRESEAACYDALLSAQLVQRRGCTPNTRQKILEDLITWAKDPHSSRLYWMNGMAGTGKTTIAYSFCDQLQAKGLLGANFFCSRSLAECSDIRHIIPTIARQLARSCPQFAPALIEVLGADFHLPSFGSHLKRLLSEPFQHISEPVTGTLIVVIDALDECSNGGSEIHLFLNQICNHFSTNTIPLKVFVTSRPEDVISRTITPLRPSSSSEWSVVRIHDIEESLVQADIKVYIQDELTGIAKTRGLEGGWPPGAEVDVIVGNANRLFVYAATVIRYVGVDSGNPRRRLSQLASTSRVGKGTFQGSSVGTQLIDELYRTILERALHEKDPEETLMARMVLKLIVCAQMPLTLAGIVDLFNASKEFDFEILASDVRTGLELLPSVISIPTDDGGVVTTFHASFPDFLFDSRRCGPINHVPVRQSNEDLARWCLHFMDKSLTVDGISGSGRWQTVDAITKQNTVESWISSALAYACMFWASHIETIEEVESLSAGLERFLTRQVLRWLEVLGLLRRLDIGVEVLQKMRTFKHPTLSSGFDDAYKYLRDILDMLNVWPSEVFYSGLVWAPEQSFIRKTYSKTLPIQIVCGRRSRWDACELIIWGHSDSVNSVAVSPDNRSIVSGSSDNTIRIWNTLTGEEEHVLRGHSRGVYSVAASPDNRHIVSGSDDNTIRIWNSSTGEEEHVLRGHSGGVYSVSVSPDSRNVLSGSGDRTVRIWNASTGEEEHVLRGHSDSVNSVAVSPDNRYVVSGSGDMTVRVWNASTGEEEHVFRGHSRGVYSVAVSPDSHHVLSGSDDNTIRIWNALTGEEEHVLQGHSRSVHSVAFSPDNKHIVSGSFDDTIRIWSASTGEEEHVLQGNSVWVTSVAVSPDNLHTISGSVDNTVRIWNALTGDEEYVFRGHSTQVSSIIFSPDERHVVSASTDKTIRIWNASTGEEEHVLRHSNSVVSVAVSPDNCRVVSGTLEDTVHIWNMSTGEEERVLRGDFSRVNSLVVAPDNCTVVLGSSDTTVRIWNVSTGEEEHVLQGHFGPVCSITVSPDNRRIVSGSSDSTVRLWNASTGEEEHVLRGHSGSVYSIAISPDNRRIVSGASDGTVRIWNLSKGAEEPPLVISFVVSSDNYYVMSCDIIPMAYYPLVPVVALLARFAQDDNITSNPLIQRLVFGDRFQLDIFLEIWNGSSLVPIALTPDSSTILLSNGTKCLAVPSTLRDTTCAAFSGSKVCFGHRSGRVTILDILA